MSLFDAYRYDGRHALVVGGATGMGGAAVEVLLDAGAKVTVMDRATVERDGVTFIPVDMSSTESIDEALSKLEGNVDALFSAAGVADGTPGIERINFLGHRYMIDQLFAADRLPPGSAIGFISSAAGFGWENNLERLNPYLDITDFEEAAAYARDNAMGDYLWSKMAVCAYVARSAMEFLRKGVRINAILPGPTNTPLAQANASTWLTFGEDYRNDLGIEASTPVEQAYPLVFLNSPAAAAITGITVVSDVGYFASGQAGSYEPAAGAVGFMRSVF